MHKMTSTKILMGQVRILSNSKKKKKIFYCTFFIHWFDFFYQLIWYSFCWCCIIAKHHYQQFFSHTTAVNCYSKMFWAGCSERVLQCLVIYKLSYSYFVSAGCHNSIRYVNSKYSDAHSLVHSIARAFIAHKLKDRYRKKVSGQN